MCPCHVLQLARLGDAHRVGPSSYGSISPRQGLRATPKGGIRRRPKSRPRSDLVRPARRHTACRKAHACIAAADVAVDHARRQAAEQGRDETPSGAPTNIRFLRVTKRFLVVHSIDRSHVRTNQNRTSSKPPQKEWRRTHDHEPTDRPTHQPAGGARRSARARCTLELPARKAPMISVCCLHGHRDRCAHMAAPPLRGES